MKGWKTLSVRHFGYGTRRCDSQDTQLVGEQANRKPSLGWAVKSPQHGKLKTTSEKAELTIPLDRGDWAQKNG